MNRVLRIAVESLIFLLMDLGALTLLLSAVVVTPPVQRSIKSALVNALSDRLGNEVSIGAVHLSWIRRLDLHDVVINDREFGDSMTIRTLNLRFALLPLLKKTVAIKHITIRDATITGIRTKRGVHFPFLLKHPPKVKLWTVTLGTAVVTGLSARYDDSVSGMYYSLSGIRSRLVFKKLNAFSGTLAADTGEAVTPWYSGRIRKIDIKADFTPKRLVVSRGILKGDSSTLNCEGTFPFSTKLSWNAHADINSRLSPVLALRKIKGLQMKGEVQVIASLAGLLGSPRLDLQATARKVTFDSIPFETIAVTGKYNPGDGLSAFIDGSSPMGKAGIKATASIAPLFNKPHLAAWNVAATADIPRISDFARRLGRKYSFISGAAHIEAAADGQGARDLPNHADLALAVKRSAAPGIPELIDCHARLNNRQWIVDITADSGNRIHAQAAIGYRTNALTGTFAINLTNPATISRSFLAYPVTGTISGTGSLGGTLTQPTVTFAMRARDCAWRSASIDRLDAEAHYGNKRLYINKASLQCAGDLATILPLAGVHNAGGHFHITAEGFGPVENPNITAEVGATDLHAGDFTASSLIASLSYRNDTLHWYNVRLGKNAAWIKTTGIAGLHGPRRFANASLIAERHGSESASGSISGVMRGDSIDASASISGMDPQLIAPWIKGKIPLHGLLSLQAAVHGTRTDPEAQAHLEFDQTLGRGTIIRYHALAALRNAELTASVSVFPFSRPESLLVSLTAPLALSPPWTAAHLIRDSARITVEGPDFPLGDLAARFLPEVKAGGSVSIHADMVKTPGGWDVQGEFAGKIPAAIDSAKGLRLYGLSAEARIAGTALHPSITFSLQGDSLYWKTIRLDKPFLQGHGSEQAVYLDTATMGLYKGRLALSGSFPLEPGRLTIDKSNVTLRCIADAVPLAILAPLVPEADISGGTLGADAFLTMRESRPHLQGRISVRGAGFSLKEYGQAFGPVDAECSLRNDSIIVESLSGHIGTSGRFSGAGYFEPTGTGHARFALSATDCHLQIADLNAIIRTASVRLADSADALVLGGNVTLAESRYQLYLSPAAMFQKAPAARPKKRPPKNPLLRRTALRILLDLDKNLIIESNLGSMTLDGTVTIMGNPEHPGIVGTISVTDGYLYYLDKKFTVQQGTFRFTNPEEMNPAISLTAVDTITAPLPGSTSEQAYIVTLTVGDSLSKPNVALSSVPALQPESIISLITFGTTQGVLSSGVASAVAGLLAQQFSGLGTRPLQQLLNIESLNVASGTAGTQGSIGTTVTAVKRLSSRLSVTYQAILQNMNRPNVSASYRLFPNVYIIGSENNMNGGIDLHFRFTR